MLRPAVNRRKAGLFGHAFMILDLFKENWAIEVNNSALPPSATKALSHFGSHAFKVESTKKVSFIKEKRKLKLTIRILRAIENFAFKK